MINLRLIIIAIICILSTHSILAQSKPILLMSQDTATFGPNGNWIYIPFGEGSSVIHDREGSTRWIAPSGDGKSFGFRSFRDGNFWDIRKVFSMANGKPISKSILYRHPEYPIPGKWEQVGEIDTQYGIPQLLVPLDRPDYFLGIGLLMGFVKDNKGSHVALYRRKDDHLIFDALINIPYKNRQHIGELEPIILPTPAVASSPEMISNLINVKQVKHNPPSLNLDVWLPVIMPDHLVLGASKAGVLWFFSLSNGECHSTLDLGEVEPGELDKIDLMGHFILGAQADKDGRLVVATRQPEAILAARVLYAPPGSRKELREVNVQRYAEIQKEQTRICWWAYDPKTGSKERIEDPGVFPEQAPSDRLGAFRFFFDPSGRVKTNIALGTWKEESVRLGINGPTLSSQPVVGEITTDHAKKATNKLLPK